MKKQSYAPRVHALGEAAYAAIIKGTTRVKTYFAVPRRRDLAVKTYSEILYYIYCP